MNRLWIGFGLFLLLTMYSFMFITSWGLWGVWIGVSGVWTYHDKLKEAAKVGKS